MDKKISVFIATSLDGYIADKNGGIDWLQSIPNPDQDSMGYPEFMKGIDAIVMGRRTFETVLSFDIDWPYNKPVFVLSTSLKVIPDSLRGKVFLIEGQESDVINQIHEKGFRKLYLDGGTTIRNFLKEDLIDEMVITTIPILLGGGVSLFKDLPNELMFELLGTETFLNQIVQSHYRRKR